MQLIAYYVAHENCGTLQSQSDVTSVVKKKIMLGNYFVYLYCVKPLEMLIKVFIYSGKTILPSYLNIGLFYYNDCLLCNYLIYGLRVYMKTTLEIGRGQWRLRHLHILLFFFYELVWI